MNAGELIKYLSTIPPQTGVVTVMVGGGDGPPPDRLVLEACWPVEVAAGVVGTQRVCFLFFLQDEALNPVHDAWPIPPDALRVLERI